MNRLCILLCVFLVSAPIHAQSEIYIPPQIAQLGSGTAETLDWHPTQDILAVGGSLGLWLYDDELNEIAHLPEPGETDSLAWSPDGQQLATMAFSGTVQLWDIQQNPYVMDLRYRWTFDTDDLNYRELAWSPNSTFLAIVTVDGIEVFDASTGELAFRLADATAPIAWSSDGTQLAGVVDSGEAEDRQIRVWDTQTGTMINTYTGAEVGLYWTDLQWHPDDSILVGVTSIPAALHAWNTDTGELLNDIDVNLGEFGVTLQAWWIDEGRQLVTAERSAMEPQRSDWLVRWDTTTWVSQRDSTMDLGNTRQIAKKPNQEIWAVVTFEGIILIWQFEREAPLAVNSSHGRSGSMLAWSNDDRAIAATQFGLGNLIRVWHLSPSLQPISETILSTNQALSLEAFQWSTDNERLIGYLRPVGGPTAPGTTIWARLVAWNVTAGGEPMILHETGGYVSREDQTIDGVETFTLTASSDPNYTWNSDFSQVAYGFGNQEVYIATVEQPESGWLRIGDTLTTIEDNYPGQMAWSPDDTMLAVLSGDGGGETEVRVYDVQTGQQINIVLPFMTLFRSMSWSPDGSMLAVAGSRLIGGSGTTEYRMQVVTIDSNVDYAQQVLNLVQEDMQLNLTWHPDGIMIAVTQPEGIGIYAVNGNDSPIAIIPDVGDVGLGWSNDGTKLASGHKDGTIRIWDVSSVSE